MSKFLVLVFLFWIGCTVGWIMELFYRRFTKTNISKKWMNPGFLIGPYLPIYGFGLCTMYILAGIEKFFSAGSYVIGKISLFLGISMVFLSRKHMT